MKLKSFLSLDRDLVPFLCIPCGGLDIKDMKSNEILTQYSMPQPNRTVLLLKYEDEVSRLLAVVSMMGGGRATNAAANSALKTPPLTQSRSNEELNRTTVIKDRLNPKISEDPSARSAGATGNWQQEQRFARPQEREAFCTIPVRAPGNWQHLGFASHQEKEAILATRSGSGIARVKLAKFSFSAV